MELINVRELNEALSLDFEDVEQFEGSSQDAYRFLQKVQELCFSEERMSNTKLLNELHIKGNEYDNMAVPAIIAQLKGIVKAKADIKNVLLNQTKEINDLYIKIEYMLKHDKMLMFKHRNDKVDYESRYIVMREKDNPLKVYNIMVDFLAYDPDFFINKVEDAMKYLNTESKNKDEDCKKMKEGLLKTLKDGFDSNHGFVETCEPVVKNEVYKNCKLHVVLSNYKILFKNWYKNISAIKRYVEQAMTYLQLMQQAYNKMINKYGHDKYGKDFVDSIFKCALGYAAMSIDFNNKVVDLCTDIFSSYCKDIEQLYEYVKQ